MDRKFKVPGDQSAKLVFSDGQEVEIPGGTTVLLTVYGGGSGVGASGGGGGGAIMTMVGKDGLLIHGANISVVAGRGGNSQNK